jgi:hypothetical protein
MFGQSKVKPFPLISITMALLLAALLVACGGQGGDSPGVSDNTPSVAAPDNNGKDGEPSEPGKDGEPSDPGAGGLRFSDLSGVEFWYGSGAGAWGTVVTLGADGAFTGYYHDSDMGDDGPGYPGGTLYECSFSGKFTGLRETGAFEYAMFCEGLLAEGVEGEENIRDGVRVITARPYGFENAEEFRLYLPGKPTAELPERLTEWYFWLADDETLAGYALYNIAGGTGFIG